MKVNKVANGRRRSIGRRIGNFRLNAGRIQLMNIMKCPGRLAAIAVVSLVPVFAWAAKPVCYTHNGTPYCKYTGKVAKSYVNSDNNIILYFDTAFGSTSEINIPGVTVTNACLVPGSSGMDFAKMFYASMLTAQATGRNVTLQMWGNASGYPRCDRVWVED